MNVIRRLEQLGGVASRGQLGTRIGLAAALQAGTVVRLAHGRYALANAEGARREAVAAGAVLSHLSAAQHYGWGLREPPQHVMMTVRTSRRLPPPYAKRADLGRDEVADGVTTPLRTVVDCARHLPFADALCVADAALRMRHLTERVLRIRASQLRGPGATRARRVLLAASPLPANAFESVARALCLDAGLDVRPQVRLVVGRRVHRVDLADVARRVVVEADSFTWHGSRAGLVKDCRRYNDLSTEDWRVLRLPYEETMFCPERVMPWLAAAAALEPYAARWSYGQPKATRRTVKPQVGVAFGC